MSEEEGKQFVDKLQTLAKDGRSRVVEMAETEVHKAMDKAGLISREEFDRLKARLEELERKLEGSGS
jgi:polyhydroxyalkanoate synthesis regulator phasin